MTAPNRITRRPPVHDAGTLKPRRYHAVTIPYGSSTWASQQPGTWIGSPGGRSSGPWLPPGSRTNDQAPSRDRRSRDAAISRAAGVTRSRNGLRVAGRPVDDGLPDVQLQPVEPDGTRTEVRIADGLFVPGVIRDLEVPAGSGHDRLVARPASLRRDRPVPGARQDRVLGRVDIRTQHLRRGRVPDGI